MAADRKVCREGLATLLRAGVTAVEDEAIFAFQVGSFGTYSPVIRVLSGGSARPPMTAQGLRTICFLEVQWFVLLANPNQTPPWTEQDAEDKLDEVDQQVAAVIEANDGKTDYWGAMEITDRSQVTKATVGGETYLMESVIVAAHVYG